MSIVYSLDGKVIGHIEGRIFYKSVNPDIHRLRQPPAWGTDADSFDKEVAPNCNAIILTDVTTGKRYRSSVEDFIKYRFTIDRGYGRQYALTLNRWEGEAPVQGRML